MRSLLDALDRDAEPERDTLLAMAIRHMKSEGFGHCARHGAVGCFDHRHRDTHRDGRRCDLETDQAGADNDDMLGAAKRLA